MDAAHDIDITRARAALIRDVAPVSGRHDALVMPTVSIVAPPLAALEAEDAYRSSNNKEAHSGLSPSHFQR